MIFANRNCGGGYMKNEFAKGESWLSPYQV